MKRKTDNEFQKEAKKNTKVIVLEKYVNSSTKIKVRCTKCGNEWSTYPSSIIKGRGCPKCANNVRKTNSQFINEMSEYNKYIEVIGEYVNANEPIEVKCKICGNQWMAKPTRLLHGAQCMNCVKPHTSFMEQFILKAFITVFGEDAVESRNTTAIGEELDIYIDNAKLAIEPGTWLYHKNKAKNIDLIKREKCKSQGIRLITIYDTYPADTRAPFDEDCYVYEGFLNEYGFKRLISLTEELINLAGKDYNKVKWNDIASEAYEACHYNASKEFKNNLMEINPNIEILEDYKGTKIPILVNDKSCVHPAWSARPETLLKGIGCPLCGRIKAADTRKRTHEEFLEDLSKVNKNIVVLGEYKSVTERISVKCSECGKEWQPLVYSLLSGKGCPHCSAVRAAKKRRNRLAVKSTKQFIEEIKNINPNVKINGEYINNKTKIDVECLICGNKWKVVPNSLSNGHGCPKCARKRDK